MDEIQKIINEYELVWKCFVEQNEPLLSKIEAPASNEENNALLGIAVRINSLCTSTIYLIHSGQISPCKMIIRNALELMVNQLLLLKYPEFINYLEYDDMRRGRCFYNEYTASNPMYSKTEEATEKKEDLNGKMDKIKKSMDDINSKLVELLKNNKFKISIQDKLKLLEIDDYYGVYRELCLSTHGSMNEIVKQHWDSSNGNWQIIPLPRIDDVNLCYCYAIILAIGSFENVIRRCPSIKDRYDFTELHKLTKTTKEIFDKFQKEYTGML